MDNNPLLPNTGFIVPDDKVWYVIGGNRGRFFHSLAAAKGNTSMFRPNYSVAVVEYNLEQGTATVIMDWKAGACEWCGSNTLYRARFAPGAKTHFDADVICDPCYQGAIV